MNPEPRRRTFQVTLSYDGTDFAGFQRQSNARSVQQVLEEALAPIEGRAVVVHGAGRTDSGVHALGQVASFRLTNPISTADLKQALNATFNATGSTDLRVTSVEEAPDDFNARFAARGKIYRYRIVNAELISPFERRFAWHVPRPLNLDAMRDASKALMGEHDFAAFQAAGGDVKTSVRTVTSSEWAEEPLDPVTGQALSASSGQAASTGSGPSRVLTYEIAGNGFLKYMVRSIVGTLIEIGYGRREPDSVQALLKSGERAKIGQTAPAHGLYLVRVDYDTAGPVSFS
jgi:tRNA pseudouridine38-40 synthase